MSININSEIPKILKQFNINEGDGILCLLSLYHKLNDSIIPPLISKQINLTKIVERDYENPGRLIWNISLYENEIIPEDKEWEWIEKYREEFGKLRSDAIGNKKNCYTKMKKYFSEHPEVRVENIKQAVQMYLIPFQRGRSDLQMLQRADYFISKIVKAEGGTEYNSRLDMYLEIIKKQRTELQIGETSNKYLNQIVK